MRPCDGDVDGEGEAIALGVCVADWEGDGEGDLVEKPSSMSDPSTRKK